ncbi:MAG: SHOCT domain-containing protein [wastewater metagenome]|nr:SHOCT domain-containing protein [Candidatus Loosdrechtia aerotolerans]
MAGLLIDLLIIGFVFYFFMEYKKFKNSERLYHQGINTHKESAIDTLKKRFASGEITEHEFDRVKQKLQS